LDLAEDSYIACYGRGFLPASVFWLNAGSVTNADPVALARFFYVYGEGSLQEMLFWVQATFNHCKSRAMKSEL
jgi:hypothetical protein